MVTTQRILIIGFALSIFGILFSSIFSFAMHKPETVIIEMSARGFNPSDISIQQGQQITFVNVDELPHWPASNIHPTHTLYPGGDVRKCGSLEARYMFDACHPIEAGKSYSFIFNEVGSWKFHDHQVPLYSGRITVEAVEGFSLSVLYRVEKSVRQGMSSLFAQKQDSIPGLNLVRRNKNILTEGEKVTLEQLATDTDYESGNIFELTFDDLEARRIVYQLGAKRTMEKLIEESDGGSKFDCHLAAHYVGRAAYDVFGGSIFEEGIESCHSGFYHGAMENLFRDEGLAGTIEKSKILCNAFTTPFGVFQCFHGIGHGLLAIADYDLSASVSLCGSLGSDDAKNACYTGTFMENIVAGLAFSEGNEGHATEWLKWDDLHYPCNEFSDNLDAQTRCYELQTSWMLIVLSYDYSKANAACLQAPSAMIPVCFQSFGRDIGGNALRNPEHAKELCALVPDEYAQYCTLGAVNTVIDFWGASLTDQADLFCAVLDDGPQKDVCYERVILRVSELFNRYDERKAACGYLHEPYREECFTTID